MRVESALELINNSLVYKPGWKISATDHTNRFEDTIVIKIEYPARNSNRDQADNGYSEEINTYATFPVIVADCDDLSLMRNVLNKIIEIEAHEAREFLRVKPTNWAPFHPHRVGGMRAWGTPQSDLQFGVA
jgi:hypothetical protein